VPRFPAGTLCVIGDLKQMSQEWLRGASFTGYGTTLTLGIGIPIPILNEEVVRSTAVKDEDIFAQIVDYSESYPQVKPGSLGEVNYAQLKSGKITINNKEVPTGGISSYVKAKQIAETLKRWIEKGNFVLTEPVAPLPSIESNIQFKLLNERPL
jgi:uncharacterized protein (DUF39 family)